MNPGSQPHAPTHPSIVAVVGGGLAGSEAALQIAGLDIPTTLFEMRPSAKGPAHHTDFLAELVCSNSLKTQDATQAAGELKHELHILGSHLLAVAEGTAVPAGTALAVDRVRFAQAVSRRVEEHPLITLVREEVVEIPTTDRVVIATGPLTSDGMQQAVSGLVGPNRLAFFDAAAPIVDAASIQMSDVFAASRYDKGAGADYLNIPLSKTEYETFRDALIGAQRVELRDFESKDLFQACQPIEEVARTGVDAMRFGPMKPVGLVDPRTSERPYAVVQLRAENADGTAYNLVGFQTNLTFGEQKRVFGLLPALRNLEFTRFGVMHRNTYLDAPRLLDATLALRADRRVRFAGQLSGTEGYVEAIATGLLAGLNTVADIRGHAPIVLPQTTALGALIAYATDPDTDPYQPMHVNWGLVPPLPRRVRGKRERYAAYAERAREDIQRYASSHPLLSAENGASHG